MKKEIFKDKFLNIIKTEDFKFGFTSESEKFLEKQFKKNPKKTKKIIAELFFDNLNNRGVLIGILRVLFRLNEYLSFNEIRFFALYALFEITDYEIQDLGLRAFEKHVSLDSIKILKMINLKNESLDEYKEEIIRDIEEDLITGE